MIEQLKTIREAHDLLIGGDLLCEVKAAGLLRDALAQLEAMVGEQGPIGEVVAIDSGDDEDGPHAIVALYGEVELEAKLYTAAPVAHQPSKATLEKLRAWETNGELIDRAWQVLQSQEQEIMRLEKMLAEERAQQPQAEASPTAGMNMAQRILHVGGRNNAAGYVEFGSVQAVEALVRQVLRDLPEFAELAQLRKDVATYREATALILAAPQQAEAVPSDVAALLQEARDALWQPSNPDLCERIDSAIARQKGRP